MAGFASLRAIVGLNARLDQPIPYFITNMQAKIFVYCLQPAFGIGALGIVIGALALWALGSLSVTSLTVPNLQRDLTCEKCALPSSRYFTIRTRSRCAACLHRETSMRRN